MKLTILLFLILSNLIYSKNCSIPQELSSINSIEVTNIYKYSDLKRNRSNLSSLCIREVLLKEHIYNWRFLLVWNSNAPKGAFWYLPHDNENSAFDSAIYSSIKYGGGFLSVLANDKRYFKRQDPNRNFGIDRKSAKICKGQKYPAPKYSRTIFKIIDYFKSSNMPYLALHNNSEGHRSSGGSGGVSMLHCSNTTKCFKANDIIRGNKMGLRDEDSLIYLASKRGVDYNKVKRFNNLGLNIKYELINPRRNDCSMSNFVVLNKNSSNYINIETEHGDSKTQKLMIDKIIQLYR
ncbi:hypothetical protein MNB_SV-15-1158 [hydrothermal vent metagenome]|uniref:Uncharacterized protein n=1 Tax=hydrothermal vent metagenome TaxID=652676 RepID=A0A1W1EHQ3_9ZZZZ